MTLRASGFRSLTAAAPRVPAGGLYFPTALEPESCTDRGERGEESGSGE